MFATALRNCSIGTRIHTGLNPTSDTCLKTRVLLVSPNAGIPHELEQTLDLLGFRLQTASDAQSALEAAGSMGSPGVILLDVQIPGVANGQLLAALQESGVHRVCAIALIAEAVSDEWIARLREGIIDDIVPRNADSIAWKTHLNTMQRGHALYCELEQLREVATLDMERDPVTGVFNRETMMAVLFRETDRIQRLRGSMCLVLMELDELEHWTSRYGPEVGDQLLREAAKRTGRILRSYDLLGRVGREQFLVALPGCSTVNAVMLAERLRSDVFGEPFCVTDGPRQVVQARLSGSFGITASRGRSPVVVLREAESTLVRGKLSGPGSIRCHSEFHPASEQSSGTGRQLFPEVEMSSL